MGKEGHEMGEKGDETGRAAMRWGERNKQLLQL